MTIGTISIIAGVVLLILLSVFFKEEKSSNQIQEDVGEGEIGVVDIDPSDDPGLAHLPGNSYHYSWSAKQLDTD